jgi:hypothetical protein
MPAGNTTSLDKSVGSGTVIGMNSPMDLSYYINPKSGNVKTGPIPVSTSSAETCPSSCPFKAKGCYASAGGPLMIHWRKVTEGGRGTPWSSFLGVVKSLPEGQVWRHNQAGDLAGHDLVIDVEMLEGLVHANKGKKGYTYTHKPVLASDAPEGSADVDSIVAANRAAITKANAEGFTINLSGNSMGHADNLAELGIGPVVCVLPTEINGRAKLETPKGRRVVVCPATYSDDVTCASCKLCEWNAREVIVGFPAHGSQKATAGRISAAA